MPHDINAATENPDAFGKCSPHGVVDLALTGYTALPTVLYRLTTRSMSRRCRRLRRRCWRLDEALRFRDSRAADAASRQRTRARASTNPFRQRHGAALRSSPNATAPIVTLFCPRYRPCSASGARTCPHTFEFGNNLARRSTRRPPKALRPGRISPAEHSPRSRSSFSRRRRGSHPPPGRSLLLSGVKSALLLAVLHGSSGREANLSGYLLRPHRRPRGLGGRNPSLPIRAMAKGRAPAPMGVNTRRSRGSFRGRTR